jgi:3-oxoacyl-[acyl-carrier-protein] synthase II
VSGRIAVTGLGWVTPLGHDLEGVFAALAAGRSGLRSPSRQGGGVPPVHAVGEVLSADLEALRHQDPEAAATGDPRVLFAAAAARRAWADAGLDTARTAGRLGRGGVALASGPGVHRIEDAARGLDPAGRFDVARFHRTLGEHAADSNLRHGAGSPAVFLARRVGAQGPVFAPVTACAAGAQAIGLALRALRAGEVDWMLAGGADSRVASLGLVWFVLLGAAAGSDGPPTEACRPFDRRRTGVVVGEGAAVAVLETEEHARARGARIRAELVGYGASLDAYRATAPCPDGRGAAQAMARALEDGGLAPEDVDLVNAHGTGTKRNDPAEVAAIKTVFGAHARRLVVPGLKSMLGHMLSASAAVAFASTVLSVERDLVPPTATLREPDPLCDLDHVAGTARQVPVRAALVNAFAFGGNNAVLALRKWTGGGR